MKRRVFAGVVMIVLSLSAHALAQVSSGRIGGTTQDETGGVMPGVSIVVRNLDTNQTRELVTNDRGQYEVPGLQPGRYEIRAEIAGFRGFVQGPVIVQVNQETRVDIRLQIGELAETLTVVGEGTIVQTTSPALGKVVETKQILELPLSGRNFADLGLLTPGITTRAQTTSAGSSFIVHGQRDDANNFQLDGVGNVSYSGNTLAARPNVDAVQEFKIQTSNFSAEFGRNSGSIVQIVTKSGSNDIRGNAWEFVRNDAFQARNFFAIREPPPLNQNQFGGTFGGPLTFPRLYSGKNRTFFFGSFEGFRQRRGLTRQTIVATTEERAGNFGALTRQLIDPDTGRPFPGNVIPPDRISPAAQALLTLMPLPNIPGAGPRQNNFVASPSNSSDYDQFIGRVDHNFGSKWSVFYRHFLQDNATFNPYQGASPANYLGFPSRSNSRGQHGAGGLNTVFSSTTLNEFRAGFRRDASRSSNLPLLDPVDFGVNYRVDRNTAGGLGLPDFTITGMSGIGNTVQGPSIGSNYEIQVSDVLSKLLGRHSLRMGGEYRRGASDSDSGFFFVGRFVFNGSYTGDGLADFLLGRAVEFNYARGRSHLKWYNHNYGLFIQDDFKIRNGLTLNLGIRYDFYSQFRDRLGRTSTWIVREEATPGVPQSGVAEVIIQGTNGLPKGATYFPDRNNFQPRAGFSWDVTGNGRLAVRGGVGIFHNQLRQNLTAQEFLSYPFYEQPIVRDTTLENPIKPVVIPLIGQIYHTDPNIVQPYTMAYSVGYQWEFAPYTILEMAYVGNRAWDLLQFQEMNQPIVVPGRTTAANKDLFRPYTGFTSVLRSTNWGRSNYNGLETSVQRRFTDGLAFQASWVWAKSLDYSSQFHSGATNLTYLMVPQDANNIEADYGPSVFDARHRVVLYEVWDLPFGAGKRWLNGGTLGHLLGSWTVASIWTFQTGFPYTVYDGSDRSLTAGSWTATSRPNLVGDPNLPPDERTPQRWFNTDAFQRAPLGQFGNAGRNIVRGPGLANTDLAVIKRVRLDRVRRGLNLEFRAEVFNLFDRVNLGIPVLDIASRSFGRIGSTSTEAREWQFGLKINF